MIYLGGDVGGIYKTEDAGRHWRMINNGLSNYAVYSIAVDPNQPDVVYAVTETGICRSTDAGEHFTLLPATADKAMRITSGHDKSVHNLAVSPKDSSVLYAGTPDGRILTSSDTGKTWKLLHEIKGQSVPSIVISPADEKLILACTSAGLLRSTDAGATWTSVADGSFSSAGLRPLRSAAGIRGRQTAEGDQVRRRRQDLVTRADRHRPADGRGGYRDRPR